MKQTSARIGMTRLAARRPMRDKRYPFVLTGRYRLALSLAMALFFAGFMLFFLPFGVDNYNPNHTYSGEFLLAMVSFAALVGAVSLANEFVLRPLIPGTSRLPGLLAWSLWTMGSISLAVFLGYNLWGSWHDFHLSSALAFVLECSSVLVFPIVGTFFWFSYRELKSRFESVLEERRPDADPARIIAFAGAHANDQIALRHADFRYAKAQDNYVEIQYLQDGVLRSHLLRSTLHALAEGHRQEGFLRCHRSFLVNIHQVISVSGSRSGLRLRLDSVNEPLPVSRSYRGDIIEGLRSYRGLAVDLPG